MYIFAGKDGLSRRITDVTRSRRKGTDRKEEKNQRVSEGKGND